VSRTTIVEIPPAEQAHILAEVRRARYGYVLALHIVLLCAAQRSPTEIAAVLALPSLAWSRRTAPGSWPGSRKGRRPARSAGTGG
jgi:hypothetical protein